LEDLTTHYDFSVRNSVGGVVQFTYGDDGLDPAELEGDAQPLDFHRSWAHAEAISDRRGKALLPYQIYDIAQRELKSPRFVAECPDVYAAAILTFLETICERLSDIRTRHQMASGKVRLNDAGERPSFEHSQAVNNKCKVTQAHLEAFLFLCWERYARARIEPGHSNSHF